MRFDNRKAQNERPLAALPEGLNSQLRNYADAAKGASRADTGWLVTGATVSAVGLGILALPPVATAEVVYTPTNKSVNEQQRRLPIDLNNDGHADASLFVNGYCASGSGARNCYGSIFASGLNGNQAMTNGGFASAARIGKIIGHQDKFANFPQMAKCHSDAGINGTSSHTDKGPWLNVKAHYLGFKFKINGETHYGWARVTTQGFNCNPSAILTGYAYETVPNRPIVAGIKSDDAAQMTPQGDENAAAQPEIYAELGMLAVGARSLEIWRKPSEDDGL